MQKTTCCFTGHRQLPEDQIESIIKRLNDALEQLILQGVTDFLCGGTRGFDQIAAALVIAKKEMGRNIRLTFALPCRDQDALWLAGEKKLYRRLLAEADHIHYVCEQYDSDCMKLRNRYMVDHSSYCVCALIYKASGTFQTVGYARQKGVRVINVATSA